ncbi:nuclear ubiquitous casein and cyclin-dependent kinase substrate 1-like isoform X2 [Callorhinchus milii]|uniref:nuclear ubiquitous casein and cyclin-dependent kinase substrate 1-like isoform X2 n=1 Tax=Callorhinchus milii TaxID=7868 RepID=UPI001C3F68F4|nr:nuclear ubiquitous casein and cyclin-dependent kinase substrate 1-like isoform X2 [Callorhinchus milii]
MSRPVRNRKVIDYSQFEDSDEEAYGRDSPPPTKRARASPREGKTKRKSAKNARDESDESDDKVYEKDLKAAIALSKKDTSHSPDEDMGSDEELDHGDSDYEASKKKGKKGKKSRIEKEKKHPERLGKQLKQGTMKVQMKKKSIKTVVRRGKLLLKLHPNRERFCWTTEGVMKSMMRMKRLFRRKEILVVMQTSMWKRMMTVTMKAP